MDENKKLKETFQTCYRHPDRKKDLLLQG